MARLAEFQEEHLLAAAGLLVPRGEVAESAADARAVAERYAGIILDDRRRTPVVLVSSRGGTGIEETAREHPDAVAEFVADDVEPLETETARGLWAQVGVGECRRLRGMVE